MVELNARLIQDARRFFTDANVHFVTQLISLYEKAVKQSQDGHQYEAKYEEWLGTFVAAAFQRENSGRNWKAVAEYSSELKQRSISINDEIDRYFSGVALPTKDSDVT